MCGNKLKRSTGLNIIYCENLCGLDTTITAAELPILYKEPHSICLGAVRPGPYRRLVMVGGGLCSHVSYMAEYS